jgi:hypothetical protein
MSIFTIKRKPGRRGPCYYPYPWHEYESFKERLSSFPDDQMTIILKRGTGNTVKTDETLWTLIFNLIRLDADIIEDSYDMKDGCLMEYIVDLINHRDTIYKNPNQK